MDSSVQWMEAGEVKNYGRSIKTLKNDKLSISNYYGKRREALNFKNFSQEM